MQNPALVADLRKLGWDGEDEHGQAWLDIAWRALRREIPNLDECLASGEITTEDIADVVVAAALRVLRNPEGVLQESGGIDDYQESWRRADASQDVYFTKAELRRLCGATDPVSVPWVGSVKYL